MTRRTMVDLLALLLFSLPVFAGGPLYVGGPGDVPGVPYRWNNSTPVTYKTDLGSLGALTKADADQFTAACFGVWSAVPTANISFVKSGDLSQDVNASNFLSLMNDQNSEVNRNNSIVYDADGSLTDALYGYGASDSILGFAAITDGASDGTNNNFLHGFAVLNGKFIDGVQGTEIPQDKFKETFIHEFGHFAGLDHSQVNVEVLQGAWDADRLAGLPTMFPYMLDTPARPSLAPDDIAAISQLYPKTGFTTTTGNIRGRVYFSDGTTQVQGVNVIARMVDDPATPQNESLRVAISSTSGFLFTSNAGNAATGSTGSAFGSRNTSLIGYYEIPGLPAGNYTVEVEPIYWTFVDGSGIGPMGDLGFQFAMPGLCSKEYLNLTPPESATDNCTDKSTIVITPGAVIGAGTDIILNGTAPTFDAWETSLLWSNEPPLAPFAGESEVLA